MTRQLDGSQSEHNTVYWGHFECPMQALKCAMCKNLSRYVYLVIQIQNSSLCFAYSLKENAYNVRSGCISAPGVIRVSCENGMKLYKDCNNTETTAPSFCKITPANMKPQPGPATDTEQDR